jgi:hypothetical protein
MGTHPCSRRHLLALTKEGRRAPFASATETHPQEQTQLSGMYLKKKLDEECDLSQPSCFISEAIQVASSIGREHTRTAPIPRPSGESWTSQKTL